MGRKRKMPKAVQRRIRETLEEEALTRHGYSMSASAGSRHRALAKAVSADGAVTVYRRLLLLRLWNRDQNPALADIAHSDAMWVGKTYGVKADGYSFQ